MEYIGFAPIGVLADELANLAMQSEVAEPCFWPEGAFVGLIIPQPSPFLFVMDMSFPIELMQGPAGLNLDLPEMNHRVTSLIIYRYLCRSEPAHLLDEHRCVRVQEQFILTTR